MICSTLQLKIFNIDSNYDSSFPWGLKQKSKGAKEENFIISIRAIVDLASLPRLEKPLKTSLPSFMGDDKLPFCLSQFKYEIPVTCSQ